MSRYSPFSTDLSNLTPADLCVLKRTTEGWYVEYKREVPHPSSIAKSISAFSNTYGGWLFYGISEKSKEEPVAGTFPGIPISDLDSSCQKIRQAAATFLAPAPHYNLAIVRGPSADIGLDPDRSIICIQIPKSPNTPHIHKDARIYRRVGDGSEPKPENDRFVLDQLWRRGDDIRKFYETWLNDEPEFSEGEAKNPYLRLIIVPDIWSDHDLRLRATVEEVREMMTDNTGVSVPFETVFSNASGFAARQLQNQQSGINVVAQNEYFERGDSSDSEVRGERPRFDFA